MNSPPIHKVRQDYMATFFEVRIAHENRTYARQAAQAAFTVTARLDQLLNRYLESSEVSQIRGLPPNEPLRVSLETFSCLQIAAQMEQLTGGAFDPILGDFVEAHRGLLVLPIRPEKPRLFLDAGTKSVSVSQRGLALDLGAIGKGFAIDQMAEELLNWDIDRALIVAGESSILALDAPSPEAAGWEIRLSPKQVLNLRHTSISTSGTTNKGGHILDPRTGQSASGPFRTWALHSSAAVSDALSTAWMLLDAEEIQQICDNFPPTEAYLQCLEMDEPVHFCKSGSMV